jgi:hypothetical protein
VKVPHQILSKPGKLTDEEFAIIKRHPVWGVELLASVEFPWDIKPIIRSHHERCDGNGYPDRLRGDEIPAQRAGHLPRGRLRRPHHDPELPRRDVARRGAARMEESRHWWRPDGYAAFLRSVGATAIAA